jgi:hypothetical protein
MKRRLSFSTGVAPDEIEADFFEFWPSFLNSGSRFRRESLRVKRRLSFSTGAAPDAASSTLRRNFREVR